ncbi:MAG: sel1 repeat family protein [Deltaproteobacteria bacterium]|nr:MAG: sel1 repeat family protein [Deltaproteobacteria bacterium]
MDRLPQIVALLFVLALLLLAGGLALRARQRDALLPAPAGGRSAEAAYRLALAYDRGDRGRPVEPKRARALYAEACEAGLLAACSNLGRLLLYGRGGPADPLRAGELFRRACEAGLPAACTNLGVTQARLGNEEAAARAYEVACRARHARACHYLAQRYERGRGVPKDPERAHALYLRACWLGHGPACAP